MNPASRSPWALARTVIAAAGLGFVAPALGGACLDYAGESFGTCAATPSSGTSGNGDGANKAGSGVGNGAPAPATTLDCGTTAPGVPEAGSGSGSAAP